MDDLNLCEHELGVSASGNSSDTDEECLTKSKKLKMMNCIPTKHTQVDNAFSYSYSDTKVMDHNDNITLGSKAKIVKSDHSLKEKANDSSARVCSDEDGVSVAHFVKEEKNLNSLNSLNQDNNSNSNEIVNQDVNSFWTANQMELLVSAIPSYKFLPRTTVQTLHKDLKNLVSNKDGKMLITRGTVKSWFDAHSDNYDHVARTDKILRTIKEKNVTLVEGSDIDDNENFENKKNKVRHEKKLTFSNKVQQKTFYIDAPAQVFITDQEANDAQGSEFSWTKQQLEVLETAVDAYKYFPKIVVKKVCKELKEMAGRGETLCNRSHVSKWLKNAKNEVSDDDDTNSSDNDGYDMLQKINDDNDMEMEDQRPRLKKIKFLSRVEINLYDTSSPASPFVASYKDDFKD